jgi:hypothetical protein
MAALNARDPRWQTSRAVRMPVENHPLPTLPMAHVMPEPGEFAAAGPGDIDVHDRPDEDDVAQLAGALRAARRARRAYVAELRIGDVKPAEDWATWYAEYLLGER